MLGFFLSFWRIAFERERWKFKKNSTVRLFSPFFLRSEKHICHTVADAVFRLFHYMAIEIGSGGDAGVSQAAADTDAVHTVEKQDACHGVSESVRIEMRQVMAACETVQPIAQLRRIHRSSFLSGKNKRGWGPFRAQAAFLLFLPAAVAFQQLHRLFRKLDAPNGTFGFGCPLIDAAASCWPTRNSPA